MKVRALVSVGAIMLSLAGCRAALPPGKPVANLTPEEQAGHRVFQQACAECHSAYSTQALHGPSLLGVFRKPYLPSGAPANDERVSAVVLHGRDMMPAFGKILDEEQLQNLLQYLHTL